MQRLAEAYEGRHSLGRGLDRRFREKVWLRGRRRTVTLLSGLGSRVGVCSRSLFGSSSIADRE